jgi:hypothetical protein
MYSAENIFLRQEAVPPILIIEYGPKMYRIINAADVRNGLNIMNITVLWDVAAVHSG